MRGILFVRLLFFSSVACIIFGSIMYYQTTTDSVLTGYSEENELLTSISEDSDQENDAGIENEKEDTDDSSSSVDDKYLNFLVIGSGGISSIIIGAFFSEIFKITILISYKKCDIMNLRGRIYS